MSPNKIIIGSKGTDPRNKSDLLQDAKILIGAFGSSDRVKRASETAKDAIGKYPGRQIEFTGHSLGGTVSAELGERFRGRTVAFNMGSSPIKSLNKKYNNITHYTTGIDPISASSHHTTLSVPTQLNVHSLANFT